jgi:hypothetical protein
MDFFLDDLPGYRELSEKDKRRLAEHLEPGLFGCFNGISFRGLSACRYFLEKGKFMEAVTKAITKVGSFAVNETKDQLAAAPDLTVHEFIEGFLQGLSNVRRDVFTVGMDALDDAAKAFEKLGVAVAVLKPIGEVLVEGVFTEVTTALSSHSLEGASFADFDCLFAEVSEFGSHKETAVIDEESLRTRIATLRQFLIDRLHGNYSARLTRALTMEGLLPAELEEIHIEILDRLLNAGVPSIYLDDNAYDGPQTFVFNLSNEPETSEDMSLMIDDDTYGGSTPIIILLESTFHYLEIAESVSLLSDYLTGRLLKVSELFASTSSNVVRDARIPLTASTLALLVAALHFYMRLVPFIKSSLIDTGARAELAEDYGTRATAILNESYNEAVMRMEDVIVKAIDRAAKDATQNMEDVLALHRRNINCLPESVVNPLFDRIAQRREARSGPESRYLSQFRLASLRARCQTRSVGVIGLLHWDSFRSSLNSVGLLAGRR